MTASFKRSRYRNRAAAAQSGLRLALRCADQVAAAVERQVPEATALAVWVGQLGVELPDGEIPANPLSGRSRPPGVPLAAWRRLRLSLAASLRNCPDTAATPAEIWIGALAAKLALDELERDVLSVAIHYELDQRVERLVDALSSARGGETRLTRDPALLGLMLGADPGAVESRLAMQARLLGSGVIRVNRDGSLDVVSQLITLVRGATTPEADFYDQLLGSAIAEPLPWEAFAHLGRAAEVAADLLRAAVARREQGVNLLLYGPPGTGKTSLAATLAARVGARLRPVTEQDSSGGEPNRYERLSGLRLAQRLAPPGETVLLFDEAEDVFVKTAMMYDEPTVSSRVFMHRLLEQATVPVIWTANDIGVLGPAVLRRMTMCLELTIPGIAVRTRLWRTMGEVEGVSLGEPDAARLARLVPAAPALASTALRAARLAGGEADTVQLIVEGIARAVAGGRAVTPDAQGFEEYDPALVNADRDLAAIVASLQRPKSSRAVSFLLSGPPGSGKSAWVRHLAASMGLEVLQKRASDLLDPFVGGTEQRIAAAFREAVNAGAFLVFDEADSLLLDRAQAMRSWEVSQVNEMLTWMEQHPLPFACTTNLPEKLDHASLRRFLVKIRFDWLTPAQARLAFQTFLGHPAPPALDALATLTPADFALVRRRAALTGEGAEPAALLELLAAESKDRIGGRLSIGFGAHRSS